jgi:Domain of unknown function (DUF4397)
MKARHSPLLLVRRISLVLALFAFVALFAVQAEPAAADSPSHLRVIQASPDIATVAVFVDGKVLLSTFTFAAVTDYATIPAGPHKIQVATLGFGTRAAAISQTLSVNPGLAYTVAAVGTKSTGLSLEVFTDDNRLSTAMAKVRIYHLASATGAMSVSTGTKALISGLSSQHASNYLTLPAGSYTFNLQLTKPETRIPVSATLQANTVTSIFVVGDLFTGAQRLQLVTKQVPGLPGQPQKGGHSNAGIVPGGSQPLMPWFPLAVVVLVLLIVIGISLRFAPMLVKTSTHLLPQKVKIPVTLSVQGLAQVRHFKKYRVLFLTSLALLAVLGGIGVGAGLWFYTNQHNALSSGPSSRSSLVQPSPHPAVTPEPTVASRQVPVSPPYPTLAQRYSGTMRDIPTGLTTGISLTSMQQQQENIRGYFSMPGNNLVGAIPQSGSLQGTVSTTKEVQFTLLDDTGQATFSFTGLIMAGNSIQGTYCSLQAAAGKCSDYGLWSVSPTG